MTTGEISLLIDGINLEDVTDCVEGPVVWPYQGWAQRGDFPVFQGIDGAGYVNQPYAIGVLPVQITLRAPACSGMSGESLMTAVDELREACRPDRLVTLTRQGAAFTHTTFAKFLNITPGRPLKTIMSCLVEWTLLDLWHSTPVTGLAAGTHSIQGSTRTTRIWVTLSAGAVNPQVTNTTNGFWFKYNGTVPTGGVRVDIEAKTARRLSNNADVSSALQWGKTHLMRLESESQVLTTTSGTISLDYAPAYL